MFNELLALKEDAAAMSRVVRAHVQYTQLLHTLNLLRWYGEVKKSYNQDSFIRVCNQMGPIQSANKQY